MNKLLCIVNLDFGNEIILVANNHKDLEDYLNKEGYYLVQILSEDTIKLIERPGYDPIYGQLKWIKHV
jgi:hypothetical protein